MDFFQSLLGGGQQGQPMPPMGPQGQNPPSMSPPPQQGGGLGAILSSPLAQGALASYFGAISSPRQMGWGGAIGRGGLAGLGQYGAASAQQAELPYRQVMTQEALAKAQAEQAKTSALQGLLPEEQKTAFFPEVGKQASILAANRSLATQIVNQFPSDQNALSYAGSIKDDMNTAHTMDEFIKSSQALKEGPAKLKLTEAQTKEAEASIPLKQAQAEANSARAKAEAELNPTKKKYYEAQASAAEARAKFLGQSKPMTDAQIETAANAEGRAAITGMKAGTFEKETTFEQRKAKAYKDAHDAAVQRLRASAAAGKTSVASAAEDPLSLIPEGAKTAIGADGTHGYVDESGFHSVE